MDTKQMRRDDLTENQMRALLSQAADFIDKIRGKGPDTRHGCYCGLEPHTAPNGCVFDTNNIAGCVYAGILNYEGKGRQDCEHWQPIRGVTNV